MKHKLTGAVNLRNNHEQLQLYICIHIYILLGSVFTGYPQRIVKK